MIQEILAQNSPQMRTRASTRATKAGPDIIHDGPERKHHQHERSKRIKSNDEYRPMSRERESTSGAHSSALDDVHDCKEGTSCEATDMMPTGDDDSLHWAKNHGHHETSHLKGDDELQQAKCLPVCDAVNHVDLTTSELSRRD